MAEGLTTKQITIVRIITMLGGFLGALLLLFEQQAFWGSNYQSSTVSDVLVAIVGVLCLLNLIRQLRIWRGLAK